MKTFLIVGSLLLAGCPTPVPPPQPDADAGEEIDAESTAASCSNWCKHALVLKCSSAQPSRVGASCVDVCNNVQTGPVKWNLKCRIGAKSCAAADACTSQ